MPTDPPPTSSPMGIVNAAMIPVPPDLIDKTTKVYKLGYSEGWRKAAEAYKVREKKHHLKGVDTEGKVAALFDPPTSWDQIEVSHIYDGAEISDYVYKRGYVDGWSYAWMAYVRAAVK